MNSELTDYWSTCKASYRHELGSGTWNDERWQEYGETTLRRIERGLSHQGRSWPLGCAWEWGCGGGAILHALAPCVHHLYGFDIAQPAREAAQAVVPRAQVLGPDFGADDMILGEWLLAPDLVTCAWVLQHQLTPADAESLVQGLRMNAADGALGLFQTTDAPQATGGYKARWARSVTYKPDEFAALAERAGWRVLEEIRDNGHSWWLVEKA